MRATLIILISCVFVGALLSLLGLTDFQEILATFPWGILVILISLEFLSRLIVATRLVEALAIKLGISTGGRSTAVMVAFTAILFITSSLINNLAAVMIVWGAVRPLIESLNVNRKYGIAFFSLLLATSNLAGASTPIGDWPAIVIMKSGITTFLKYLMGAFPLFAFSTIVLTGFFLLIVVRVNGRPKQTAADETGRLGVEFLRLQHLKSRCDTRLAARMFSIFAVMFVAWSILPTDLVPPEVVALVGASVACVIAGDAGKRVITASYSLEGTITLATYLLAATVAQVSGVLSLASTFLLGFQESPRILLLLLMLVASILTGIFSAGPTAAALMPVIHSVTDGTLSSHRDLVAIAFAAGICAGSSLFLHSASAGPLLSQRVSESGITDNEGGPIVFSWTAYLPYGIASFVLQFLVAGFWVMIAF
jgi:Na+/H+ antiporter NhaD/arsenite permease-like protein